MLLRSGLALALVLDLGPVLTGQMRYGRIGEVEWVVGVQDGTESEGEGDGGLASEVRGCR